MIWRMLFLFVAMALGLRATTYNSDGSMTGGASSVQTLINGATSGDTITIPAGSFTWGASGASLSVNKAVTIQGAGDTTVITMSPSGPTQSNCVIRISAAATVKDFAVIPASGVGVFACSANGFEISGITYNEAFISATAYFAFVNNVYGWIHGNDITGASGTNELIYIRGPSNAWQSPSGIGDANAVYIESNVFSGPGYVCDANSNAKVVVRFNTIAGGLKIDGHGIASNGAPPNWRGCRRIEAYCNDFTYTGGGGWTAFELRGGKNVVFNNTTNNAVGAALFKLRDYGYLAMYDGFQGRWQTPFNYPLLDQIGVGQDEVVSVSLIAAGDYVGVQFVGSTTWGSIGSTGVLNSWFFATGPGTGSGMVTRNTASDPSYLWGNTRNGAAWARSLQAIASSAAYTTDGATYPIGSTTINFTTIGTNTFLGNAIVFAGDATRYLLTSTYTSPNAKTLNISPPLVQQITGATSATVSPNGMYQYQLADAAAFFNEDDIIHANRDFYATTGFDTGGVGTTVGTDAQMALTSAVGKLNQAFWVTNEGAWNTQNSSPGTPGYQKGQGRLYVSDNTNWVLTYTPLTYPFDDTAPAPAQNSASINSAGTQLTILWSESCTSGTDGSDGVSISASGGASTATYSTGSGSNTYVYNLSRTINAGETVTNSYVQPGNGIKSTSTGSVVLSFSGLAVNNNSTVNAAQNKALRTVSALGGGF